MKMTRIIFCSFLLWLCISSLYLLNPQASSQSAKSKTKSNLVVKMPKTVKIMINVTSWAIFTTLVVWTNKYFMFKPTRHENVQKNKKIWDNYFIHPNRFVVICVPQSTQTKNSFTSISHFHFLHQLFAHSFRIWRVNFGFGVGHVRNEMKTTKSKWHDSWCTWFRNQFREI